MHLAVWIFCTVSISVSYLTCVSALAIFSDHHLPVAIIEPIYLFKSLARLASYA